ncbi:hypothetical protein Lal_00032582 [Lupinus albus]|nr:hypothetical protein Lal_00032582 [Lupinus albus]
MEYNLVGIIGEQHEHKGCVLMPIIGYGRDKTTRRYLRNGEAPYQFTLIYAYCDEIVHTISTRKRREIVEGLLNLMLLSLTKQPFNDNFSLNR